MTLDLVLPAIHSEVVHGSASALPRLAAARGVLGVVGRPEARAHRRTACSRTAAASSPGRASATRPARPGAGTGVHVALIDTGVSDSAFLNRASGHLVDAIDTSGLVATRHRRPVDRVQTTGTFTDGYGHGTFMASLIAGGGSVKGGRTARRRARRDRRRGQGRRRRRGLVVRLDDGRPQLGRHQRRHRGRRQPLLRPRPRRRRRLRPGPAQPRRRDAALPRHQRRGLRGQHRRRGHRPRLRPLGHHGRRCQHARLVPQASPPSAAPPSSPVSQKPDLVAPRASTLLGELPPDSAIVAPTRRRCSPTASTAAPVPARPPPSSAVWRRCSSPTTPASRPPRSRHRCGSPPRPIYAHGHRRRPRQRRQATSPFA